MSIIFYPFLMPLKANRLSEDVVPQGAAFLVFEILVDIFYALSYFVLGASVAGVITLLSIFPARKFR